MSVVGMYSGWEVIGTMFSFLPGNTKGVPELQRSMMNMPYVTAKELQWNGISEMDPFDYEYFLVDPLTETANA